MNRIPVCETIRGIRIEFTPMQIFLRDEGKLRGPLPFLIDYEAHRALVHDPATEAKRREAIASVAEFMLADTSWRWRRMVNRLRERISHRKAS